MTAIRKTVMVGLAALTVAGGLAATSAPALAWHGGWGGPFAVGAVGGFAAGALLAGAAHPYYGAPAYAYGPPPAYYGPEPVYDPCYRARRPVYDAYGYFAGYRSVRVCN